MSDPYTSAASAAEPVAAGRTPASSAAWHTLRRLVSWWPGKRLGGLRWMLGASYMRVTLTAVVALELVGLGLLAQGVLLTNRRMHAGVAQQLAPITARLVASDADPNALQAFIERPVSVRDQGPPLSVSVPRAPQGYTVVVDATGQGWYDIRAFSTETREASSRTALARPLPRAEAALVERAMANGETRARRGLIRTSTATPLRVDDGPIVGALLQVSTLRPATPGLLALGVGALAVATILVVLIGTMFGLYASRPLTRRIEQLAAAADAWSDGDFSRAVHDPNDDELGRLSRRLDRMAGQLRDLVAARQAVAGAQERTRIARDLHDSVKQQVFAASMRLAAARALPPDQADAHLAATESLVHQAQQELSDLIHELRPVAIEGRPLEDAVRELAEGYVGKGGPLLELHLEADLPGTPDVGAALYRIAQEALANAVRHAQARRVSVDLRSAGHEVVLAVTDDGRGFVQAAVGTRGIGLSSMRERATAQGGTLTIDTGFGRGTRVEVRLPTRGAAVRGERRETT